MKRESSIIWFWVLLIFGMGIGMTNLFAPVHELGHYILAVRSNQDIKIVGWAMSRGEPNVSQSIAGYLFEYLTAAFLALGLGWAGHYVGGKCFIGSFPFGYSLMTWFTAYSSYDMTEYIDKVSPMLGYDPDIVRRVAQNRITAVCLIGSLVLTVLFIKWHKKGRTT